MKVIVASDVHLGKTSQEFDLETSIYKDFTRLVKKVIDIKPDVFLLLGDIFDNNHPTPTTYTRFINLCKLLNNNKITTHILVGNHEVFYSKGKRHSLYPIKIIGYKYIKVIDTCRIVSLSDNVDLLAAPYIPEVDIPEENKQKDLNVYYNNVLSGLEKELDNKKYNIFVSHLDLLGAKYSDDFIPRTVRAGIPKSILNSKKMNIGINGHLHKYQKLKYEYPFIVCPNLSHTSFSPNPEEKFFIEFDTE